MNHSNTRIAGDTGSAYSGTIIAPILKGQANLDGWTLLFSLHTYPSGPVVIDEAPANYGDLDPVAGSVPVYFNPRDTDVVPQGEFFERWVMVLPDGRRIPLPADPNEQALDFVRP